MKMRLWREEALMRIVLASALAGIAVVASPVAASTHAAPGIPGGSVLFSGGPGESLYAIDARGDRLRLLAPRRFVVESSAWSPDGKLLAYTHSEGACCPPITVITIEDHRGRSRDVAALRGFSDVAVGSWSPDGSRLVVAGAVGNTSAIFVVDVRSGRMSQVTHPGSAYDQEPKWSPNGSAIIFVRSVSGAGDHDLWFVHPDGSDLRRLTSGADVLAASWAPDSRRVVVVGRGPSEIDPNGRVEVVNVVTGRARTLLARSKGSFAVAWSPNGRWIALSGTPDTSARAGGTYLVRPDGKRLHRVSSRGDSFRPISWSPDSRAIAVPDSPCHTSSCCTVHAAIWVVLASGSAARRLTKGATYGYSSWDPQWQPASLPAARLGGLWVPASTPTDSVVGGTTLVGATRIAGVSADGTRAVVEAQRGCFLKTWNAADGSIEHLPEECGATAQGDIVVAGDRFAWTTFGTGPGVDVWAVRGGTFESPSPTTVFETCDVD